MAKKTQNLVGSLDTFFEHKLVREGKMPTPMAARNYLEEKIGIEFTERNTASFNKVIRRVSLRVRNRIDGRKKIAAKIAERVYSGMTEIEKQKKNLESFTFRWIMAGFIDLTQKTQIDAFVIMKREYMQSPFLDADDIPANIDKPIPGVKYKK